MVADIEPVTHVLPIAGDRQQLAGQGVVDDQRDKLFRELIRAIIVGAVADEHQQPIGMMPGPHEVIRCSLGGRVGAVGRNGGGFGKGWIVGFQ